MNDSWNLRNPDNEIVELFSSRLDITVMLSTFLVNRKVSNLVEADIFLNPNLDKLPNPFLLKGMTKTCLLYTSPSPRDRTRSRMPSSA